MSIEIRNPTEDERELLHRMSERAFRRRPAAFNLDDDRAGTPLSRRLVATLDGTVVGKLGMWELGQWFGERCVPTAGVAGVAVEPHVRGQGVASVLLRGALDAMRERGEALATLFPMNHTLYRRRGWEIGGSLPEHEVPAQVLGSLPLPERQVELRPTRPDDLTEVVALHREVARHEPGNLAYGQRFAPRRLLGLAGQQEAYVATIDGSITGALSFVKDDSRDGIEWYSFSVRHLSARDRDSELALWQLLASYHPLARTVRFTAPPQAALPHLLGEREVRPTSAGWAWMTRFVDAAAAFEARGYPPEVSAEIHLDLVDETAPWNAGPHILRVKDGTGSLEPGGAGTVRVPIGQLAAIYTGWADPATLSRWGFLPGAGSAEIDALRRCFAGKTPWSADFF